jgi:predicted transposase YbfD/YdcC
MLHQKKVGTLPVGNGSDEVKQTNEIKYAPLLLDEIAIKDKNITSDALHTQVEFAHYLVKQRKAHYYFSVKGNQPTLIMKTKSASHMDELKLDGSRQLAH